MNNYTHRRAFLQRTLLAASGLGLLSTSAIQGMTATSPFEGYNPFAEEKTDLRTQFFGDQIRVKGKLFDAATLHALSNTTIEVWHLSPNSNKYRHRAKLRTDENGHYSFITDYPNREAGRLPRIYFKVTKGDKSVFTDLMIGAVIPHISGEHWLANQHLGESVYPTSKKVLNTTTINFNLSI